MKHVEDIRALIDLLLVSNNFHSLVIEGAPGWGKSSTVESVFIEKKIPFLTLGSYTTPLRLFSFLSENSKGILIIDDCAGIFSDSIAMSILKAATWPSSGTEGTRLVSWGTTSDKVAVRDFFFDGKILLLTNSMPSGSDGMAFISRSLHYSITPTSEDKESILRSVASSGVLGDVSKLTEVADVLIARARQADFRGVNLRTLQMGYELALSGKNDWKELFTKLLPAVDPVRLAYITSSENGTTSVEEQFREFHRATGLSRRTFFYYRQRVRPVN